MAVKKRKVRKAPYRKSAAAGVGGSSRGSYGTSAKAGGRGGKRAKAPVRRRKP